MSTEGLLSLLLLLTALLLAVSYYAWRLRRTLHRLEDALHRAEAAGREQAVRIASLEQLRESQKLAEHAVETGTALVREVHRGVADIPFGVLGALPGAREPVKALRGVHDAISEGIYSALSGLNKAVGRELRKGLEAPAITEAAAKPAPESPPGPASKPPPNEAPEPAVDKPGEGPLPDKPWKNWG